MRSEGRGTLSTCTCIFWFRFPLLTYNELFPISPNKISPMFSQLQAIHKPTTSSSNTQLSFGWLEGYIQKCYIIFKDNIWKLQCLLYFSFCFGVFYWDRPIFPCLFGSYYWLKLIWEVLWDTLYFSMMNSGSFTWQMGIYIHTYIYVKKDSNCFKRMWYNKNSAPRREKQDLAYRADTDIIVGMDGQTE